MIFNEKIDEVLNIIISTSGKNSLEITKFIKNLPIELINIINEEYNKILLNNEKDITYFKSDNWNYYCHIKRNNNNDRLYLGMYLKDKTDPLFYIELIIYNYKLKKLNNYTTIPIVISGFVVRDKKYRITYYLKKFPSEYLITSEAVLLNENKSSRHNNYIEISSLKNEINISDLDGIINNKIKNITRKRNKR